MKGKNSFKRGCCKLIRNSYTSPFDAEVIRKATETNILPPFETMEIETNKYFVAVELYDCPSNGYPHSVFGGGRNHSFYSNLKDRLEEIQHKKDILLKLPYDFLQFRKKGSNGWHPLVFSDSDATGVLGFLPERFQSQYPNIRWEKMKCATLEEAIEKTCGAAEDEMDDILNYA